MHDHDHAGEEHRSSADPATPQSRPPVAEPRPARPPWRRPEADRAEARSENTAHDEHRVMTNMRDEEHARENAAHADDAPHVEHAGDSATPLTIMPTSRMRPKATTTTTRTRRRRRGGSRRIRRRRRRAGGSAGAHLPAAPPVQDPGSHQAPPGDAGPGRQGRARQQGRGADDLSVAGRPLRGADAQYRARRRHQPQDHLRAGPLAAEGSGAGSRRARGHGHHPAHRRRLAHQARDQARLRISDPHVGNRARHDPEVAGPHPRLRGRLADQALAARPLQQGNRRNPGRRRSRLPRSARFHEDADAARTCGR